MKKYFFLLLLGLFAFRSNAAPQVVKTGIFLMSVTKFNISDGHYQVDFYLTLSSDSVVDDNFDLMNGQITAKQIEENTPHMKVFRVKALCYENLNFRTFPFENHALSIQLEHKLKPKEQLIYVADEPRSGVDPQVGVIGWKLHANKVRYNTSDHFYRTFNQTYSRFNYVFTLEKPLMASLFKGLIPPLLIVSATFLLFFMNPNEPKDRVNATASMLIANVVLHINSTSALPPLGYATFQDKLMITNYVAIGCSLMVIMMLVNRQKKGRTETLEKFNRNARWIVLGGYTATIITEFLVR